MFPYGSVSYINTGQSIDPSVPVAALLGHIEFRQVSVGTLFWHNRTRQSSTDRSTVLYWCTIHVRTPWARHGVSTGPPLRLNGAKTWRCEILAPFRPLWRRILAPFQKTQ